MRVLRRGGKFTDSRIQFYIRKAIGISAVGVLIVLFALYGSSPQIGMIAAAMLVVLLKVNIRRWAVVEPRKNGRVYGDSGAVPSSRRVRVT
jgi:hypothetical protein